jgi:Mrp family chromosome partitioning ATPase
MAERSAPPLRRGLVDPGSTSAEPFRTLRLALQLRTQSDDASAMLVTSAEPGAGKSTLAANYASLSARGGARVLLVDADLRTPAQHEIFGAPRAPGLVEFVADRTPLAHLVLSVRLTGDEVLDLRTQPLEISEPDHDLALGNRRHSLGLLHLLTAGQALARPSDVSHSARIADLLAEAAQHYDVVIVDAPPVLATADAEALAAHPGVEIVFVVGRASRRRNVARALRRLELINAHIAGLVLNRPGE